MILAWYAAHFGDNELALAAFRRGFVDIRGFTVEAIWYPALSAARKRKASRTSCAISALSTIGVPPANGATSASLGC